MGLGLILAAMGCGAVDDATVLLVPPLPAPDAGPTPVDAGPTGPDAGPTDTGPTPIDAGPVGRDDGDRCITADDCAGDVCLRSQTWSGGYCTSSPCADDQACGRPDSVCVTFEPERIDVCAARCGPGRACRTGYDCVDDGRGRQVCLPEQIGPGDLEDGEPCAQHRQCRGGTCLQAPEWPGGHCTTLRCEDECASHLGADNECVPDLLDLLGDENWCARVCTGLADCREGYACLPLGAVGRAGGLCVPDTVPVPPLTPVEIAELGMQCGLQSTNGRLNIDYAIAPDTSSYMVTVLSRDGRYVVPRRITGPPSPIDFRGRNRFQSRMVFQGWVMPVLVPQTPETVDQRVSGPHRFELETRSQDVCWYLMEEQVSGPTLDLNVHLVGLRGIDASNARQNPTLQAVLQAMERYLRPTGVSLGDVRYYDASPSDTRRFEILRSDDDFVELMQTSQVPGASRDEILSLNLFFVRSIMYPDGGPLGISSALPGPAGLHGTTASGVVSTAEYFGARFRDPVTGEMVEGNDYTGLIIGHEIGHYLGLFHTTEVDAERHDPIGDTPECTPDQFPLDCPDLGNLMFPLALPSNTGLSAGQRHTIDANPLSKP